MKRLALIGTVLLAGAVFAAPALAGHRGHHGRHATIGPPAGHVTVQPGRAYYRGRVYYPAPAYRPYRGHHHHGYGYGYYPGHHPRYGYPPYYGPAGWGISFGFGYPGPFYIPAPVFYGSYPVAILPYDCTAIEVGHYLYDPRKGRRAWHKGHRYQDQGGDDD